MLLRKSRGLQRQNAVLQHFVCIAKRAAGHGVNSNFSTDHPIFLQQNILYFVNGILYHCL